MVSWVNNYVNRMCVFRIFLVYLMHYCINRYTLLNSYKGSIFMGKAMPPSLQFYRSDRLVLLAGLAVWLAEWLPLALLRSPTLNEENYDYSRN